MPRRFASLIAVATLLAPLPTLALPPCATAEACPMAAAAEHSPPCHGSAIQAADCCAPESVATAPIEVLLTTVAVESAQHWIGPPSEAAASPLARTAGPTAPRAPLYTLHRALLI